jgi:hypothetical protein
MNVCSEAQRCKEILMTYIIAHPPPKMDSQKLPMILYVAVAYHGPTAGLMIESSACSPEATVTPAHFEHFVKGKLDPIQEVRLGHEWFVLNWITRCVKSHVQ